MKCPGMELLETLACKAACSYISDLRQPEEKQRILRALYRLDPTVFSLWEWEDAFRYLTGISRNFNTNTQAAKSLIEELGKESS